MIFIEVGFFILKTVRLVYEVDLVKHNIVKYRFKCMIDTTKYKFKPWFGNSQVDQ